jgi:hypothetical protein
MSHYPDQYESDNEKLTHTCQICGKDAEMLTDHICDDCIAEREHEDKQQQEVKQVHETVNATRVISILGA